MIAALYVETDGVYYGLEDVDPWDEARDARLYAGPWPVVAHPPCNRWSQLARVNQSRWGTPVGEDGGTFWAALEAVRRFGGVLEHPRASSVFGGVGGVRSAAPRCRRMDTQLHGFRVDDRGGTERLRARGA